MNTLLEDIKKHKAASWLVVLIYLPFFVTFHFPLRWEVSNIFSYALNIVILGVLLAGLIRNNILKLFCIGFLETIVGLICRYFLEYGEVSNTVDFIPQNIFIYAILMPALLSVVYYLTGEDLWNKA